jgi:hypothetical protein
MASPRLKGLAKSRSGKKEGPPAATGAGIDLSDLATALAKAVLDAKGRLDEVAVAVADKYRTNPFLRFLPPPAFAIGEVRVVIKFAIAETEHPTSAPRSTGRRDLQVHVHVDAASLHELPPHLVSEIELRIMPEVTRAHLTKEEAIISD